MNSRSFFVAMMMLVVSSWVNAQTHCRSVGHRDWLIREATPAEFSTKKGRSYEIRAGVGKEDSDIKIRTDDRFHLKKLLDGRIALRQMRTDALTGEYTTEVGFATLTVDSSSLWARGAAHMPDGRQVGEYVIFRTPDRGAQVQISCMHSGREPGAEDECYTMLFEYFDDDDKESFRHKPFLNHNQNPNPKPDPTDKPNVFLVDANRPCNARMLETQDGDGDEGPDQ